MKRYLLLFLICFFSMFTTTSASTTQVRWYKSYAYAQAAVYNGVYFWSDWVNSIVNIKIDWDNDIVVIYSKKQQVYKITDTLQRLSTDNNGGKTAKFSFYDQDGDRGIMYLRFDNNGQSQIYIHFSDVAWVYTIVVQ